MENKHLIVQIGMGMMVFLFGLALAYFSASYAKSSGLDYWFILMLGGIIYLILGLLLSILIPISFAFMMSADILILHVLSEKYATVNDYYKFILLVVSLLVLYGVIWLKRDKNVELSQQA